MPIVEFKCTECGHSQQTFLKEAGAKMGQACDLCGGGLRRVFSAPSIAPSEGSAAHSQMLKKHWTEYNKKTSSRLAERKKAGDNMANSNRTNLKTV